MIYTFFVFVFYFAFFFKFLLLYEEHPFVTELVNVSASGSRSYSNLRVSTARSNAKLYPSGLKLNLTIPEA